MDFTKIGSYRTVIEGERNLMQDENGNFHLTMGEGRPVINILKMKTHKKYESSEEISIAEAFKVIQKKEFQLKTSQLRLSCELAEALGFSLDELLGKSVSEQELNDPDTYEAINRILNHMYVPINKTD